MNFVIKYLRYLGNEKMEIKTDRKGLFRAFLPSLIIWLIFSAVTGKVTLLLYIIPVLLLIVAPAILLYKAWILYGYSRIVYIVLNFAVYIVLFLLGRGINWLFKLLIFNE